MPKIETTVVTLRSAARTAGVTGFSRMKKDELLRNREIRTQFYKDQEAAKAADIVAGVLKTGHFFLPRPALLPYPVPNQPKLTTTYQTLGSNSVNNFQVIDRDTTEIRKLNDQTFKPYVGLINAIKANIKENGLRQLRYSEDASGFRVVLLRKQAA